MSDSPPGTWTRVPLGDIADVQLGKMLDGKRRDGLVLPYLRNVNVRWYEVDTRDLLSMAFKEEELDRFAIRPGDVLVCEGGEPGRAAVWTKSETGIKYQKALHRVRMSGGIDPRWLVHHFRWDAQNGALQRSFTGTTIKHLPLAAIRRHEVCLAPLPEQHRIVAALDSYLSRLDAAVAALERVQANLSRYRASVLQAAVEGRLVPTEAELARLEGRDYEPAAVLLERILAERRRRWEEAELAKMAAKGKAPKSDAWKAKYKEPVAPETEGLPALPALPEGWCWATLPQLGELNRGKSKHRPRNDPRILGGPYPFVQTGDVRHSGGTITGHTATYSELGLAQSRLWPAGTLCITIAANIANTGILSFDACFPDSIVGFLNVGERTLTRFIEFFMRTAREDLDQYAPATAQKNINLQVLSEVAVPVPPPAEQMRIVGELDRLQSVCERAEHIAEHGARRSARLCQSVLSWAFGGKLVNQDPTDEPADELLKRIQTERAAATPKARRKTTRRKARTE